MLGNTGPDSEAVFHDDDDDDDGEMVLLLDAFVAMLDTRDMEDRGTMLLSNTMVDPVSLEVGKIRLVLSPVACDNKVAVEARPDD